MAKKKSRKKTKKSKSSKKSSKGSGTSSKKSSRKSTKSKSKTGKKRSSSTMAKKKKSGGSRQPAFVKKAKSILRTSTNILGWLIALTPVIVGVQRAFKYRDFMALPVHVVRSYSGVTFTATGEFSSFDPRHAAFGYATLGTGYMVKKSGQWIAK